MYRINKKIVEILKKDWAELSKYQDNYDKIVVSPKTQFTQKAEIHEIDSIMDIKIARSLNW